MINLLLHWRRWRRRFVHFYRVALSCYFPTLLFSSHVNFSTRQFLRDKLLLVWGLSRFDMYAISCVCRGDNDDTRRVNVELWVLRATYFSSRLQIGAMQSHFRSTVWISCRRCCCPFMSSLYVESQCVSHALHSDNSCKKCIWIVFFPLFAFAKWKITNRN